MRAATAAGESPVRLTARRRADIVEPTIDPPWRMALRTAVARSSSRQVWPLQSTNFWLRCVHACKLRDRGPLSCMCANQMAAHATCICCIQKGEVARVLASSLTG
jgi:hypothetical protein